MSAGPTIKGPIDQVVVEAPAPGAGPSINMPDHEVRTKTWYQVYVRLARPSLDWITNAGVAYSILIGPAVGDRPPDGFVIIVLGWAGVVYGLKSYEKVKGFS